MNRGTTGPHGRKPGFTWRSPSSRLSQPLTRFQLALFWSTILRSPTASFGSVNQASLHRRRMPRHSARATAGSSSQDDRWVHLQNLQRSPPPAPEFPPLFEVLCRASGLRSTRAMTGDKRFVYVLRNADQTPQFHVVSRPMSGRDCPTTTRGAARTRHPADRGNFTSSSSSPMSRGPSASSAT